MHNLKPKLIASAIALTLLPATVQAAVLEEVTVTAQKREQSVQDVGISITAFSGAELRTNLPSTSTPSGFILARSDAGTFNGLPVRMTTMA